MRIIPSSRLILALLIPAVVGVMAIWFSGAMVLVWLVCLGLGIASLLDLLMLWRTLLPVVVRKTPRSLVLGRKVQVGLSVQNLNHTKIRINLFDHTPGSFELWKLPLAREVAAGTMEACFYSVRPRERGDFVLAGVDVQLAGPLGLWWRQERLDLIDRVKVFPDFKRLAGYAMNVGDYPLSRWGMLRKPKSGEGMEFHQLREYRPGDRLRQINWKATARQQRVISIEYQEEREQTTMILMDCGRRMRSRDTQGSYFDQALDATLLLSCIALRQGDAVGFAAFNGDTRSRAPAKGRHALHALLNTVYDIQPSAATFDFSLAARRLVERRSKRSLVIVVTQIGTEDLTDLTEGLRLLCRYHLVMLVTLRDKQTDILLGENVEQFEQALRYGAVQQYLDERGLALEKLRHEGVLVLDALPEELPLAMVNRYMEVKRAGQL